MRIRWKTTAVHQTNRVVLTRAAKHTLDACLFGVANDTELFVGVADTLALDPRHGHGILTSDL